MTLATAAEALLARKRDAMSRRTGRPLRPASVTWRERTTRPWRGGAIAELPVSLLRRAVVEEAILVRAVTAPKSARDELHTLKAILHEAARRGARVDGSLLTIEAGWR
jgi:hypothetical protein